MVQLILNFTLCVVALLMHAKLQKLACAPTSTVARNFGMYTWTSEHMRHT